MSSIIRKEARRLQFLLDSNKLSDLDKDYMKSFFSLDMDAELQEESIATFSELLYWRSKRLTAQYKVMHTAA